MSAQVERQREIERWPVKDPGPIIRAMDLHDLRESLKRSYNANPDPHHWPTLLADAGRGSVHTQLKSASRGQLWTYAAESRIRLG